MNEAKISTNTLIVVVGLVISVAWIILGLVETPEAPGLSTTVNPAVLAFSVIATLAGLVLIPICTLENKWGFLSALVLGIVILIAEGINQISYVTGTMSEHFVLLVIGGAVWIFIQIPIIIFSYRAYRELCHNSNAFPKIRAL